MLELVKRKAKAGVDVTDSSGTARTRLSATSLAHVDRSAELVEQRLAAVAATEDRERDAPAIEAPVRARRHAPTAPVDWHVAIGPYLWAASVDANVSAGGNSVDSGLDYDQLQQHAKCGAEVLAEARYGSISVVGDLTYGVVAIGFGKDVGPVAVAVDGTASSVLVDGLAGVRLAGDDRSRFAVEARGGIRYQRTAVTAHSHLQRP